MSVLCVVTTYGHVSVHMQYAEVSIRCLLPSLSNLLFETGFAISLDLAGLAKLGQPEIFLSPSPQQWNYSPLKITPLPSGMPLRNVPRRAFDTPAFHLWATHPHSYPLKHPGCQGMASFDLGLCPSVCTSSSCLKIHRGRCLEYRNHPHMAYE